MVRLQHPEKFHQTQEYIYKFIKQNNMSDNINNNLDRTDFSIDLAMFVTSLKALREHLPYEEMNQIFRDIKDAHDRGKMNEFLDQAVYMFNQGTDLPTSFHYALFDLINDQGQDF